MARQEQVKLLLPELSQTKQMYISLIFQGLKL
ncbi:hypothetical protein SDC9_139629 [bioreactor metagenome]|uniref:Uncharacterized protein n=1 Tax=bioreactor metagenome TaxID=1076179 RepID=A0A645DSN2_9ZZZZ